MSDNISLDPAEAAARAAEWREYADLVERQGRAPQVPIEQLRAALGDVYAPYLDAKAAEYEQREAAYSRVAAQARSHADKLLNTRSNLTSTDDENAARIAAVIQG